MGFVIVISLPLILFILIAALACYLFGKSRGRREAAMVPPYYGPPPPAPPPGVLSPPPQK
uniref:Transmembrane protein n=1 Tax=Solanum lycopersicum TaxID=4081 RepID=A0A3Q7HWL1_SOLLC